jgi:5-methylcytosine-specific restriction protein A
MPVAPSSRCTDPECHKIATNRGRCDDHQPIPWAGRDNKARRYGISSGTWRSLKNRVTRRDNGCCYICGDGPPDDPDQAGHQLDHITPISEGGAATDLDNLGLACVPCHEAKSRAEARRANQARIDRKRRPD